MTSIAEFYHRLRNVRPSACMALTAETAHRLVPVYEAAGEGPGAPEIRQAVDLAWSAATGGETSGADQLSCEAALEDVIDALASDSREGGLSWDVIHVVYNALLAIPLDDGELTGAAVRGLAVAEGVAELSELVANDLSSADQRTEVALAEERSWQDQAIEIAAAWMGTPSRDMFVDLAKPRWLADWRTRTAGHQYQ